MVNKTVPVLYVARTKSEARFAARLFAGKAVPAYRKIAPGEFISTTIVTPHGLMPNPYAWRLAGPRQSATRFVVRIRAGKEHAELAVCGGADRRDCDGG